MSSASRSHALPEAQVSALARVYALAIRKYQEKGMTAEQAPKPDGPNDAMKGPKHDRAKTSIPE